MTTRTFRLPDVGEGLTEAEIVRWLVAEGETVAVNAPIVEIETAKSLVELPSPWAGRVERLLVPEGLTVDVGTAIVAVGVDDGADPSPSGGPAGDVVVDVREGAAAVNGSAPTAASAVLVGYGVKGGAAPGRRRTRRAASVAAEAASGAADPEAAAPPADAGAPAGAAGPGAPGAGAAEVEATGLAAQAPGALASEAGPAAAGGGQEARPLAKPPVRSLARAMGVDLADVTASGPGGVVTREDVLSHRGAQAPAPAAGGPAELAAQLVQAGASGARESRVAVRGVRRATAQAMVASAFTAPHATAFLTVDATRTVKLLDRLREDKAFTGVHVSPLLVIARALCLTIARHPEINATWDEAAQEIVVKHYVNLGVAVATPRGLLVPNVKDAQALDLRGLAEALTTLVKTARAGRSSPGDLAQGTISVTNIGVFGVDTGTPILNAGEAAILCVGAVTRRPWVHKGKVKPRWVVQLSLSFDHRVVDGDLGSRVLADVGALLERPDRALLWA